MQMMAKRPVALNPIQWLASEDGWLDFVRSTDRADLLAQIKGAGYGAVSGVPGVSSTAELRVLLGATGLVAAPGYLSFDLPTDESDLGALVERSGRTARDQAELGLHDLVVAGSMSKEAPRVRHPARRWAAETKRLTLLGDVLARLADVTLAEGVRPALYPHVGTWIEIEETRALLDRFPADTLGLCPDTGHVSWTGADVYALIADYASRIPVVHLKDCSLSVASSCRAVDKSYQDTVLSGLWSEPGPGELDLEGMLARLPTSYAVWLVVEVDRPAAATPLESAEVSAAWMSAHVRCADEARPGQGSR